MFTLMIFATLLIPFYYYMKFKNKNTLEICSIIGFNNEHTNGTIINTLDENTLKSIQEEYDRVTVKINYNDNKYKYTCLTKHLNLPIQIQNEKQTFISKAEVCCENNTYDVTEIVKKYSGPNDDFFGNPFNMSWIFPEYKETNKQACLKIYSENKIQHTIDLLTNEEIVDPDDTEDTESMHDFVLYDSDIDSFTLEDSE